MVSSIPRIEQRGPVFRLHWPEDGVQVKISRIYQAHRGEVYGEISVQYRSDLPFDGRHVWRHVVGSRYQITSVRSRVDIAKQCESEVSEVPWRHIIEEASINVLNLYRRGADVLDLSEWTSPKDSPVGYRLTPLLAEGLPNMIFGDGGVGKSMVALWLSTMVTEGMQEPFECNPGNVLYLDWEMEAEETQGRLGRIAEGMGLPTPPRVFYRRCAGRLVDDVEWLAETVQSKGIDLVVVDSAVPACGGNPNEPESVQSLFYGLRQLEVTSLIVAHVSKSVAAGPQTSPFGSVFWSNLSRNVWQAQKEQEMGEDSMVVALWHRKTNVGPLLKPVTLKITFSPSFSVERVATGEYKTLASKLPLAERMAAALGNGAMSSSALAEAIDANSVRLRSHARTGRDDRFVRLDGREVGTEGSPADDCRGNCCPSSVAGVASSKAWVGQVLRTCRGCPGSFNSGRDRCRKAVAGVSQVVAFHRQP